MSTKYTAAAFNIGMLVLRAGAGILMIPHGYDKLINFNSYSPKFMSFLGMPPSISLALTIFAELFCGFLVVIGLFTRLAAIPLIMAMSVVVFIAAKGAVFGDGEHGALFLLVFTAVLLLGPGRISADGAINK